MKVKIFDDEDESDLEEDINNFLSFHSELQGRTVEEIRKELETQMQMESVRNDVLGDKVYKFLAGVNKAEETKMTKKEYEKSKTAATENSESDKKEEKTKKKTSAKKAETEAEEKPKKTRTSKKKEETAD